MIPTVLSTKKLEKNQKELLLNAGIGFVEAEFIKIEPLPFNVEALPQNVIFTSKNAVKILLESSENLNLKYKKIFCVGSKTAAYCRKNGLNVTTEASYGAQLADLIIDQHKNEKFLFFCGRKRHEALPEKLKEAKVSLSEVEVYDTIAAPIKFDRTFEGVLFFSPSAVRSYCSKNDLSGSITFCIGRTTAAEAEKHSTQIVLASKPSVENVIVQVVKYFKRQ